MWNMVFYLDCQNCWHSWVGHFVVYFYKKVIGTMILEIVWYSEFKKKTHSHPEPICQWERSVMLNAPLLLHCAHFFFFRFLFFIFCCYFCLCFILLLVSVLVISGLIFCSFPSISNSLYYMLLLLLLVLCVSYWVLKK